MQQFVINSCFVILVNVENDFFDILTLMRAALRERKSLNMQFGALVSLFTLVPVLNLAIMPVAVCGATAMWVDCYRGKHASWR